MKNSIKYWRDLTIPQSSFARLLLDIALWWDGVPSTSEFDPATSSDFGTYRLDNDD